MGKLNCQACGRPRELFEAERGRLYCKACLDLGEVPCVRCGRSTPGGKRLKCDHCYWSENLDLRKSELLSDLFEVPVKKGFEEYVCWLSSQYAPKVVSLKLRRHIQFFVDADRTHKAVPSLPVALQSFGTAYLRKFRNIVQWLEFRTNEILGKTATSKRSEWGRIERMLSSFEDQPQKAEMLNRYAEHLFELLEIKKIGIRTIRLYLRPALDLLVLAGSESDVPTQADLDKYLRMHPGQRASLSRLLHFYSDWSLVVPRGLPNPDKRRRLKRIAEKNILVMLSDRNRLRRCTRPWMVECLCYFHGVSKAVANKSRLRDVVQMEEGFVGVYVNDELCPIPRSPLDLLEMF